MTSQNDPLVQELIDKQALQDLVYKLSRAIDRADEELVLSCYHPDARDDHGSFKGSPVELLEYLRSRTMDPSVGPMHHAVTNSLFEVQGDVAFGESYVEVRVVDKDGVVQRSIGRYVDRFERRDGEWRIAIRRVILEAARPGYNTADFIQGFRDRLDPSYDRTSNE